MAGGPGHRGAVSDHFDGRVFRNPGHRPGDGAGRTFREFLRWRRTAQPARWPAWVQNQASPALPASLADGEVALTFINHITFLIQLPGLNILTDPVYSERVSPLRRLGPARVRDPGLPFGSLPPIHLVLVSHNHYDHLDLDTLVRLEHAHRPMFMTGLGNQAFLTSFGLTNVRELDWWERLEIDGMRLAFTPAQHWSGRGGRRTRNRTLWGGFHLQTAGSRLFFAGDTGFGGHFREVRDRLGPPDLALLPIGAYAPRWFMGPQHMDPQDAVRAHLDLSARVSIGTHFGCFQLTDEDIDDPVKELAAARALRGLGEQDFQVLETGETRLFRTRAAVQAGTGEPASATRG